MTRQYGFGITLPERYEQVIPRVKEALKSEQFGVLTEIDVRQTLLGKVFVALPCEKMSNWSQEMGKS